MGLQQYVFDIFSVPTTTVIKLRKEFRMRQSLDLLDTSHKNVATNCHNKISLNNVITNCYKSEQSKLNFMSTGWSKSVNLEAGEQSDFTVIAITRVKIRIGCGSLLVLITLQITTTHPRIHFYMFLPCYDFCDHDKKPEVL